jgi:hypothetical protein
LVRRNYQFEKRQKDLARKKKKEEKLKRKQEKRDIRSPDEPAAGEQDDTVAIDIDSSEDTDDSDDSGESDDTENSKDASPRS